MVTYYRYFEASAESWLIKFSAPCCFTAPAMSSKNTAWGIPCRVSLSSLFGTTTADATALPGVSDPGAIFKAG